MGHLRSTVIGNALGSLAEKCGYTAVRINHLGDWGTQFGKLITAYKKWGSPEKVKENPIKELLSLYVRFHVEAEANPALEDEARSWFKELENGNEQAQALWSWFRDESLKEFQRVYDMLGIHFDSYNGEAFYNDKMEPVIVELMAKDLLAVSDGAEVVQLPDEDLPPCLIKNPTERLCMQHGIWLPLFTEKKPISLITPYTLSVRNRASISGRLKTLSKRWAMSGRII